jgi:hypothetical protein
MFYFAIRKRVVHFSGYGATSYLMELSRKPLWKNIFGSDKLGLGWSEDSNGQHHYLMKYGYLLIIEDLLNKEINFSVNNEDETAAPIQSFQEWVIPDDDEEAIIQGYCSWRIFPPVI